MPHEKVDKRGKNPAMGKGQLLSSIFRFATRIHRNGFTMSANRPKVIMGVKLGFCLLALAFVVYPESTGQHTIQGTESNHSGLPVLQEARLAEGEDLGGEARASWFDPSWSCWKQAAIANKRTLEPLVEYQVSISLNSGNLDSQNPCAEGEDIKFTASDGKSVLDPADDSGHDFPPSLPIRARELREFNCLLPFDHNPVVPCGSSGAWDEHLREIGNVLYEPMDADCKNRYRTFYSGYRGAYCQNTVFIGYATSADGIKWVKHGKAAEFPAEDPYVVKHGDTYYMYYEDKSQAPFRNINLATSKDCEHWSEYRDNPVLSPHRWWTWAGGWWTWESQDVSSPVVWLEGDVWYMLYEGRGLGCGGTIALASSLDGKNWQRDRANPVFGPGPEGEWDGTDVVCDDLIRIDEQYYLFYHGYGESTRKWQSGVATSRDLRTWRRSPANPINTSDTTMVFYDGEYVFHHLTAIGDGIGRYYPAQR